MLRGAKASIEVLRSDEGRALRQRHGDNVRYLRNRLFEAGVAAVHTPSHIIPIHVSELPDMMSASEGGLGKVDVVREVA